jgi:drug/metabolite transporter (DMT)-like permease
LTNFQVFFMALAGLLLYRERLGPRFVLGAALAFLGTWFLVGASWHAFAPAYRAGVWLGLLSGVAYTVYLLGFRDAQRRRRPTLPASVWLAINSLLCALLLGALALAEGSAMAIPDSRSLLALVALGVIGQCLGWLLIVRAMPQLPASLVGLLLLLQPALAFVLDVILFQRVTGDLEWLGLGLALAGIFIGSVRLRRGMAQ